MYVYAYSSASKEWSQQAKIKPIDGVSGDNFGYAVTSYDNLIVVGSYAKSAQSSVDSSVIITSAGVDTYIHVIILIK